MTDTTHHPTPELDDAIDRIASETAPEGAADAAGERVWPTVLAEAVGHGAPIRGCRDFRVLVPAWVDGRLPEDVATLVEDHSRECVGCRRAVMEARSGRTSVAARPSGRRWSLPKPIRWSLAAAAALVLVTVGLLIGTDVLADQQLLAHVDAIDGALLRIEGAGGDALTVGGELRARQAVRTAKGSGAVIRLADGTLIEMAERSELTLRGRRVGPLVRLARGSVIVQAAPQGRGRLEVVTDSCEVGVKGTIFAVNHGAKGSRVSVVEGEVEVEWDGNNSNLLPGEQLTTDPALRPVPVADEIAWSRNLPEHLRLLRELTDLQRSVGRAVLSADVRTSTRLLDLQPAGTVAYASVPNVSGGLEDGWRLLQQRLESSPELRRWWSEAELSDHEGAVAEVVDRVRDLGETMGDEIAFSVLAKKGETEPIGVLVTTTLRDPAAFRARVGEELDRLRRQSADEAIHLIDDPAEATGEGIWLWTVDDLLVVASGAEVLDAAAAALRSPSERITGSTLHRRLAAAYADGVEWLLAVDAGSFVDAATEDDPTGNAVMERTGFSDIDLLVAQRTVDGDRAVDRATLEFDGPRRGIAAWLAEPAPMGSLSYVSPQATFVSASALRDGADLVADLLDIMAAAGLEVGPALEEVEAEHGIDPIRDLAEPLGGEILVAFDGPVLPTPSWKVLVEVYDPARLQGTIERLLEEANRALAEAGSPTLGLTTERIDRRTYVTVDRGGQPLFSYLFADGYLIAGPTRAVVERALAIHASGSTFLDSSRFTSLLPADRYAHFSAIVFNDLGPLTGPLARRIGTMVSATDLGGDGTRAVREVISSGPHLVVVYGEEDRITISHTGDAWGGVGLPAFLASGPAGALGTAVSGTP